MQTGKRRRRPSRRLVVALTVALGERAMPGVRGLGRSSPASSRLGLIAESSGACVKWCCSGAPGQSKDASGASNARPTIISSLQGFLHVTTVLHGIPRVAIRLGSPLKFEIVNKALQGALTAAPTVMSSQHVPLDPIRQ
jgi:hypothetical protein